jgi:MoaA/NifB/PqqE/SkfB family radical SAM enzyme
MSKSHQTRAGFLPARVVHLHPSRFCNLACQHCYSLSGPHHRGGLEPALILSALTTLRTEGYDVLSLSGGEPLLYFGFEEVVTGAAALGYQVNLISNGAPVGGRLLDIICEYVNLIAISLDGGPKLHSELRGDVRAFDRAERAIDRIATVGAHFGIAYCVSRESLEDMPWSVEFARTKGAALVQFHPFAATGRGVQLAGRLTLSQSDKARAYVAGALLDLGDSLAIHIDLAPVETVRTQREDYAVLLLEDARDTRLSDLINPLVIDETGRIVPFSYGIAPEFALGRLGVDFPSIVNRYKLEGWQNIRSLLNSAFNSLGTQGEFFVDWFYHLVEVSMTLPSCIR